MTTYRIWYTWEDDTGRRYNDVYYTVAEWANTAARNLYRLAKEMGWQCLRIETMHRSTFRGWEEVDDW